MSKPTFKDIAKVGKPDGKKAKAPCGHNGTHVSASLVLCDQGCDDEEKTDPGRPLTYKIVGAGDGTITVASDADPFYTTPAIMVPCPHKNVVGTSLGIYCYDCGTCPGKP